ncbi:MAG: YqhA family protein [Nitrospirae bacterium]|nr:YqhA family protein [Nitrospirota bacterium]MBI3594507.1 YqhA family protein [Nitrospirota bacterium]
MNRLEWLFENLLWKSRYIVLTAVVSSLVSSFILFFFATGEVFGMLGKVVSKYVFARSEQVVTHMPDEFHNDLVSTVIGAVDDYLLATVLLIFALGLYELFISKIDHAEKDAQYGSRILLIKNLDDLKDRLAKVILMILIVTFFKNVIHATFEQPLHILYLGGGILFVALALYFTHRSNVSERP